VNVAGALLAVAALFFVAWPLLRPAGEPDEADESLSPLERQKLDAYAAIKEAEFDLRMGKLSDVDFASLTQRYRQQALAAISSIERSKVRERGASANIAGRAVRFAFCPSCGQKLPARANFCGGCGRALREEVA
jgi:hypothetical protein